VITKLRYFFGLMITGAVLFFLSVGIGEEIGKLMKYMNRGAAKTVSEWLAFTLVSILVGGAWCCFYLGFKYCEKKFLEEEKRN
jgi:hypothetical protein